MARGRLITFEGGEGCGKTTQLGRVAARLRERGLEVVETREPGGTALGEAVRSVLLDPELDPDGMTELFLFEAARRDHVRRVIEPALDRGAMVLSDRFADSSTVYQGYVRSVDEVVVAELNRLAVGGVSPDLTLVLDLPARDGLARVERRGANSRQDVAPRAFHDRVVEGFRRLAAAEPERVHLIAADGAPDQVFDRIVTLIDEVLP